MTQGSDARSSPAQSGSCVGALTTRLRPEELISKDWPPSAVYVTSWQRIFAKNLQTVGPLLRPKQPFLAIVGCSEFYSSTNPRAARTALTRNHNKADPKRITAQMSANRTNRQ